MLLHVIMLGVAGTVITAKNYQELVTGKPFLIDAYHPFCGHCAEFRPKWDDFVQEATKMQSLMQFGELNCELESKLCKQLDVDAYPELLYFNGLDSEKAEKHRASSTVDGLIDIMNTLMSRPVTYLNSKANLRKHLNDSGVTFVLSHDGKETAMTKMFRHAAEQSTDNKYITIFGKKTSSLEAHLPGSITIEINKKVDFLTLSKNFPHHLTDSDLQSTHLALLIVENGQFVNQEYIQTLSRFTNTAWVESTSPLLEQVKISFQKHNLPIIFEFRNDKVLEVSLPPATNRENNSNTVAMQLAVTVVVILCLVAVSAAGAKVRQTDKSYEEEAPLLKN